METPAQSRHGMWSSRWLFVLAAAGSAVGLGNIWKFPYITGENGGGAFVIVYLLCIAFVGIPILAAEVMLGRAGRQSPINTMRTLTQRSASGPAWVFIGWAGALAGFLILSYYSVIAGWALYYIWLLANGTFEGVSAETAAAAFNGFLERPLLMTFWHGVFMAVTVFIVARGVVKGLEAAIRWFMPLLFLLLVLLLVYAVNEGDFARGAAFMFDFRWDALGLDSVLIAMGQAFFTLSLGMGAMMAYGAYVPADASIGRTVISVALLDTTVAIAAGLAIFPIVFANCLEPAQGPGLMFVTLPLAFGHMPLGALFGAFFFVLVGFAAITSSISLTEPALAFLVEDYNAKRARAAISLGVICWALGIGSTLSFNVWADVHVVGTFTIFDFVDYVTQNVMLPLGGLFIALFAGWVLPRAILREELQLNGGWREAATLVLVRVVSPLAVLAVFCFTLYQTFTG